MSILDPSRTAAMQAAAERGIGSQPNRDALSFRVAAANQQSEAVKIAEEHIHEMGFYITRYFAARRSGDLAGAKGFLALAELEIGMAQTALK